MPIVSISVARGRDQEVLRRCLQQVHDAVRDSLGVPEDSIRVTLQEIDPQHWSSGGVTLSERSNTSIDL